VSLCDSFPNLRRHDDLSKCRNSLIERNNVTELKAQVLRMQFAFTLYFTGHNFVNSVVTYFHWNHFSHEIHLDL